MKNCSTDPQLVRSSAEWIARAQGPRLVVETRHKMVAAELLTLTEHSAKNTRRFQLIGVNNDPLV